MFKTRKTRKIERLEAQLQAANMEVARYKSMFKKPIPTKHPDLGHKIELAFEIDEEVFYRFENEVDLASYPRYQGAAEYLELYPLKLTKPEFIEWIITLNNAFDAQDGSLARMLTNEMMNRQQHLTHIESVYQIAAQVFFKLEDDLGEVVPPDEVQRRIALFKKKPLPDFIALKPIDSIMMQAALLEHFSGDVSKLIKIIQTEQVIKKAQLKSWSRRKKATK